MVFTYDTIYPIRVYNSVVVSTVTKKYNFCYSVFWNIFILFERNSIRFSYHPCILPSFQP